MYQDHIPTEDLPRKYIDVIQAAQQLGVQYLWIDSLCIIHDDLADWEFESSQMRKVYQHGYCNPSAASSTSSNDGLFYKRDATWVRPHVIVPGNNSEPIVATQVMDMECSWPLSGVARVFHERIKSTYLAGIWSDKLLLGLTWQRPKHLPSPRARNTEYIAPSWSWVSTNTQVNYGHSCHEYHTLADCEEVGTVPYGNDPFGRVQSGRLRLRCDAIPFQLESALGTFVQEGFRSVFVACVLDDNTTYAGDQNVYQVVAGSRYYAVPLLSYHQPYENTPCLILEPLMPAWGLYRRVGLYHLHPSYEPEVSSHRDNNHKEVAGDMPAICKEGLSLGVSLEHCRVLARMIRASQEADVPASERAADGRCLINII
ncbi:heterokaryon incompatibility protein-domain-containing protein [Apiospora saccharicola]|uniref:Heterokaryon incompatibility protein-domain-containing protein n=1 Tax=Apiospora saccharicola TaxID=335842 RepID=A0ABR1UHL9_9PEZI